VVLALACALAGAAAPRALADGDPASDVLASQQLFLPSDGGFPESQAGQLAALLRSAHRGGYRIRVAVISSRADLGSVTELWRKPQLYEQFLGQELSQVYSGTLLVAMPDGFGVGPVGGASAARGDLGVRATLRPLLPATMRMVQRLGAGAGHPLALPRAAAAGPGTGSTLGSVDLGSWVALLAGAILIALAWAASLRARPPARLRRAR
jgi:hypothetical protein